MSKTELEGQRLKKALATWKRKLECQRLRLTPISLTQIKQGQGSPMGGSDKKALGSDLIVSYMHR